MVKIFLRFFAIHLLITLLIITFSILFFKAYPHHYFTFFPFLLLVFFIITPVVHLFILRKVHDIKKFYTHYMAVFVVKFFVLAILALYYKITDGGHVLPFLLSFFILYIIYQVYETTSVLRYIKNKR